jgi:hypothetical protein
MHKKVWTVIGWRGWLPEVTDEKIVSIKWMKGGGENGILNAQDEGNSGKRILRPV